MKRIIRLTENDLHNIVKESVENILTEAGFFGGLRRAYNMGDTLDYLIDKDTRKTHQRGVDRDRAKTGLGGRNLGLSGYYTKADRKKLQDEVDNIDRGYAEAERERAARRAETQRYYDQQRKQQEQQNSQDIYSQTIAALDRHNYNFFSGRKDLQGVLQSLYNQNKITYNQYNEGLQMIGRGYVYPSGQSDGLY